MTMRATWVGFAAIFLLAAPSLQAASLHEEIDRLILAKASATPLAGTCNDATFLRRAYFDLAGRIPRLEETQKFLSDSAADKRTKLIDELLAGPEYPRRMEELFHVIFMERRGDNPEWSKFLRVSFETNKPWDQLTREILHPAADDANKRGAAFFHTKRLDKNGQETTDYPGLTRDVGRLFMGVDLQCAQCHDHLFIGDYKQVDFQGLLTVFANTSIKGGDFPAITEKPATTKLEFSSVFEGTKKATGPRIPFGTEFDVPPATGSALALVATALPAPDNKLFVQNAVNRFWFIMMGRGLVHPLDLQHAGNPPSHPELLELMSREFVAQKFDVKWLLRELALSNTYARSSEIAGTEPPADDLFAVALERRLSAEQILRSMFIATGDPAETRDEAKLVAAMTPLRPKALKAFANPPKEPEDNYNTTVQEALTLLNDEAFQKLFEVRPGSLTERLARIDDLNQLADELYLTVLIRRPTEEERAEVAKFLGQYTSTVPGKQKSDAVRYLAWALVASTEFSINH